MSYSYDMLEPNDDLNVALEELTKVFAPLYTKNWVDNKAKEYGNPPFDMNVNTFAQMWFGKALRIFMAYDDEDGKPVGYLIGIVFRPLQYRASVFQIEDWYGGSNVIMGLFDYAKQATRFMGIDELWVSHDATHWYPAPQGWVKIADTVISRYSKK